MEAPRHDAGEGNLEVNMFFPIPRFFKLSILLQGCYLQFLFIGECAHARLPVAVAATYTDLEVETSFLYVYLISQHGLCVQLIDFFFGFGNA
jgi:hypothetical protein